MHPTARKALARSRWSLCGTQGDGFLMLPQLPKCVAEVVVRYRVLRLEGQHLAITDDGVFQHHRLGWYKLCLLPHTAKSNVLACAGVG
jgi:hypothetical protein